MADKIKLALALALVGAGIAGFYASLRSGAGCSRAVGSDRRRRGVAVAWQTEPGQRFVAFAREAIVETRKVVWPTRKETVQTTGIVFAFVVVMAIFLWLTDKSLEWVLYDLILGWK
jgi:preprotein translocase subunit SecE